MNRAIKLRSPGKLAPSEVFCSKLCDDNSERFELEVTTMEVAPKAER
jgi:hypothetical protein